jgi:TPR repeat protein
MALLVVLLACGLALPETVATTRQPDMEQVRELLAAGKAQEAQATARVLARAGNLQAQETLASMLLRGIGSAPDREAAMAWLCLRVHAPEGGRAVTQSLWLLAEYFRTGGGLPGRRYNDGDRSLEDPVKAYFWFKVMAGQKQYYDETVADAARLGRLGVGTLAKQLTPGERQSAQRRLETWSPAQRPESPARCLELPWP